MFDVFSKLEGEARGEARMSLSDDEGTVTVFTLFLAIMFAMIMGMAIDVTIAQYEQARLQATADRAALAAADIDQSIGARDVVDSYFETAGLLDKLDDVELPEGSNGPSMRRVRVKTSSDVPTAFMHLLDVDFLKVAGYAEARDAFSSIEVSLVLDVSGSMRYEAGGTPRITLLKDAAGDFVKRVLAEDNTDKVSISLVPYAGQVNVGPELFALLGGQRLHNGGAAGSSCLEITADDFDDLKIPSSSTVQVPHFMYWTIDWDFMQWGWCPDDTTAILPISNDAAGLEAKIDGMHLHDGTGTAFAVKWGLALLDPSSRDTITDLRALGVTGPISEGRPAEYDDDVRKILVLMTDGKITDQWRPLWTTGVLWTGKPGAGKEVSPVTEFVPGQSASPDDPLFAIAAIRQALDEYTGDASASEPVLSSAYGNFKLHKTSKFNTVARLRDHFDDLEDDFDVTWNFDQLPGPGYAPDPDKDVMVVLDDGDELSAADIQEELGMGYLNHWDLNSTVELNNQYNHHGSQAGSAFRINVAASSYNVGRFKALCREAKEKGVEIFTIAFEAPRDAQNQMQFCASSDDDHYYEVNESDGGSLANAFNEIAASISELRLTQ